MGGSAAGTAGLLGALVSRPGLGEDVGFPVVWPDMGGANPPSTSNRFIAVLLSVFVGESLQPHSVWDQRYQEMLGIGNYPGFWLSPGHWLC